MGGAKEFEDDFERLMASTEKRAAVAERLTPREKRAVRNLLRLYLKKGLSRLEAEKQTAAEVRRWRGGKIDIDF
jgi:uncharacterized NAD(P)/FAD-binding protein YdhS